MPWSVGQTLKNSQYTILSELGQGGFGITYLAQNNLVQDKDKKFVVIKTLNDDKRHDPKFNKYEQDFLNEARMLAKCSSRQNPHPHIVQIYELFPEGNVWCMVMEYINEESLAHRVHNQGVLSDAEALHYIRQMGNALTVVHKQGLLHRDVKPLNIMLRPVSGNFDDAVLIDFGIAREFTPNLTKTHTGFVSNGFAPIEQYDQRTQRGEYTDVYALAATLYYLLTDQIPIDAQTRAYNLLQYGNDPFSPPSNISANIKNAILKGMEIQPESRSKTVKEWLGLLDIHLTVSSSINQASQYPVLQSPNSRSSTASAHTPHSKHNHLRPVSSDLLSRADNIPWTGLASIFLVYTMTGLFVSLFTITLVPLAGLDLLSVWIWTIAIAAFTAAALQNQILVGAIFVSGSFSFLVITSGNTMDFTNIAFLTGLFAFLSLWAAVVSGAITSTSTKLLHVLNKTHTYLFVAGASISGLGAGWLLSSKFQ